jgi:hypothetical protein
VKEVSLDTTWTAERVSYDLPGFGPIGHGKIVGDDGDGGHVWGFIPEEGHPAEVCRVLLGTTCRLKSIHAAGWMALVVAQEIADQGLANG